MASNNGYGSLFQEWEGLDNACEENASALTGVESVRASLVKGVARVKALKARQESLEGERMRTTQEIRQAVEETKEAARCVREFIKARLGTRNERLTQFGVAPIRKRGGRKRGTAEPTA